MSRASTFWSWFAANERRYLDLEVPEKERLLDELQENLQAFCKELWFEVGGAPTGPRELVITAEGNLKAFPALLELCKAAPSLPGWLVVAFKQPQGFEFTTEYEDILVAPQATWFLPLFSKQGPQSLGLRLAFSHYEAKRRQQFLAASYVMLEAGLGELAAAEHVSHVDVCLAPSTPETEGYRPLTALPDFLERRTSRSDA